MASNRTQKKTAHKAVRIGTFFDIGNPKGHADREVALNEPICDWCGAKTRALRAHNKDKICWTCKALTVGC